MGRIAAIPGRLTGQGRKAAVRPGKGRHVCPALSTRSTEVMSAVLPDHYQQM